MNRKYLITAAAAALALTALFSGCDDDEKAGTCVPGQQIECTCSGSTETSVQVCTDDGTYGVCRCDESDGTDSTSSCADDVSDYTSCMDCYCEDEQDACNDNADCVTLEGCVDDCGDDTDCTADCSTASPNGVDDLIALFDCRDADCAEYDSTDPSDTDPSDTDPSDTDCASSVDDWDSCYECYCSTDGDACYNDADCSALLDCFSACESGDDTCISECATEYEAGIDLYNTVVDCLDTNCSDYSSDECADSVVDASSCLTCYCSGAIDDCYTNDSCYALLACFDACDETDTDCIGTCFDDNEEGTDYYYAIYACEADYCLDYMNDPTDCADDVADEETCEDCYCYGNIVACVTNDDCISLNDCLSLCDSDDDDCMYACIDEYPDGYNDLADYIYCVQDNCSEYLK